MNNVKQFFQNITRPFLSVSSSPTAQTVSSINTSASEVAQGTLSASQRNATTLPPTTIQVPVQPITQVNDVFTQFSPDILDMIGAHHPDDRIFTQFSPGILNIIGAYHPGIVKSVVDAIEKVGARVAVDVTNGTKSIARTLLADSNIKLKLLEISIMLENINIEIKENNVSLKFNAKCIDEEMYDVGTFLREYQEKELALQEKQELLEQQKASLVREVSQLRTIEHFMGR